MDQLRTYQVFLKLPSNQRTKSTYSATKVMLTEVIDKSQQGLAFAGFVVSTYFFLDYTL